MRAETFSRKIFAEGRASEMATLRNREEAINTQFAVLISKLGTTADAETILIHGKHRPDLLLQVRGLRVVIEAKFADFPRAENVVLADAHKRVRNGIAHIALAVIYPKQLRSTPTAKIIETLEHTKLRYRVVSETDESEDWYEGTPSSLMASIRRIQQTLAKDDIVERTAKLLSAQLDTVASLWNGQTGTCNRLAKILGLEEPDGESAEKASERRESAAKVAALVLANAFIFQEQLSISDTRVLTLQKLAKAENVAGETASHWQWIWKNVDYVPIFQLGERVLDELPTGMDSVFAINALLSEAQSICRQQAALRHDLMGRIYHWLLHEAKYLGTYYTSTTAATLLLKLVFTLEWKTDFTSPFELANFKIADFACGTGTLLMAGAQAITDRHIRDRVDQGMPISEKDIAILHQTLMQNIMHGYDVLPTAVHLTASTLALLAPEVAFRHMNLFVMPLGLDHQSPRLGSLDFLHGSEVKTQFALDDSQLDSVRTSVTRTSFSNAHVPELDLCVMNPPFVRSGGNNLLFGSLPHDREILQKELSKLAKSNQVSSTAGLGAMFVPLALKHLKAGGRIAFVLPVALASGESWKQVRDIIAQNFSLEIVISSHDSGRPNFSENTDLSEVLFIARRLFEDEEAGSTYYVNLWRNPHTIHEALNTASLISDAIQCINFQEGQTKTVRIESGVVGEVACFPSPKLQSNWTNAIFAQCELMKAHWALVQDHCLETPDNLKSTDLDLCRLGDLGDIGYQRRDILDAFEVDKTASKWSRFKAYWNHDARKITTIAQKPNATLIPRSKPLPNRKLKDPHAIWAKSSNIQLVSRLWPVTHRIIAAKVSKKVVGNTWWAFDDSKLSEDQSNALLLWMNSTIGILSVFGCRSITRSAFMAVNKPAWLNMPVINVRSLSDKKLETVSKFYEDVDSKEMKAISQLASDNTRKRIDEFLGEIFDFPDLGSLRELLAREPGISAKPVDHTSFL